MNKFVPKDIVISTEKVIYIMAFLCLCVTSFSIVLLTRHKENTTDSILSSLNLSIPLILLCFCYIIRDNHDFYTSSRSSQELINLSNSHDNLQRSHDKLNSEIKETINCSKNKTKDEITKTIKNIQINNKNELQKMQ